MVGRACSLERSAHVPRRIRPLRRTHSTRTAQSEPATK
jgi:hypothetical protein